MMYSKMLSSISLSQKSINSVRVGMIHATRNISYIKEVKTLSKEQVHILEEHLGRKAYPYETKICKVHSGLSEFDINIINESQRCEQTIERKLQGQRDRSRRFTQSSFLTPESTKLFNNTVLSDEVLKKVSIEIGLPLYRASEFQKSLHLVYDPNTGRVAEHRDAPSSKELKLYTNYLRGLDPNFPGLNNLGCLDTIEGGKNVVRWLCFMKNEIRSMIHEKERCEDLHAINPGIMSCITNVNPFRQTDYQLSFNLGRELLNGDKLEVCDKNFYASGLKFGETIFFPVCLLHRVDPGFFQRSTIMARLFSDIMETEPQLILDERSFRKD